MQRQCEYLQSQYPDGELVKEVGGGLNYKRKKMLTILERIMSKNVKRIVVTYQDRLARFGFDLLRLGQHIDKLIRAKTTLKGRKNKYKIHRISQKINRLLIRIKNLIDEVHKKVAKCLTTEYRVIFIPTFELSQMVAKSGKKKRKLNSKTVRKMLHWAHYRFKKTLKFHGLKRAYL